jgi:hypothetical protein
MPMQIDTASCAMQLELLDEQRNSLHREPLTQAVFARAILAARFDAFRRHRDEVYRPTTRDAAIEPLFIAGGDPRCHGFRVRLELPDGNDHAVDFPLRYFYSRACATWEALSKRQTTAVDPVNPPWAYQLLAYLEETEADARSRIVVETSGPPLTALSGAWADLAPRAIWDGIHADDLPVAVCRKVIDDAFDEAKQFREREVAGLLLGEIRCDPTSDEVYLLVSCYVPGGDTAPGGATAVSLTPATFSRANELIALRRRQGRREIVVGWAHSHPFKFCAECPLPTPPECIDKVLFYSTADLQVMQAAFADAFAVGLLVAPNEPKLTQALGHPAVRLFGYRQGVIVARGFTVVGD